MRTAKVLLFGLLIAGWVGLMYFVSNRPSPKRLRILSKQGRALLLKPPLCMRGLCQYGLFHSHYIIFLGRSITYLSLSAIPGASFINRVKSIRSVARNFLSGLCVLTFFSGSCGNHRGFCWQKWHRILTVLRFQRHLWSDVKLCISKLTHLDSLG